MNHTDHVNLLRPANLTQGTYADFGAGSGAFTLALRELVGLDSIIYAVDKNRASLNELDSNHRARFQTTRNLILLTGDFSRPLDLPPLDGIVMANSLHFFRNKDKILRHVRDYLKPNGVLMIVEYNVDRGNMWVPYPFTFETFRGFVLQAGFGDPRLLAEAPSRFLNGFYSAVAYREQK